MKNKDLRPIDRRRLDGVYENTVNPYGRDDIWFIHAILAQCFLPYRDPKTNHWRRKNGDYSILLTAGAINDESKENGVREVGLPYGAKPRLFQSYICTQALRQKSPVVSVENSMSSMMHELGYKVTGGKEGSISKFKEQITRFAACHFTVAGTLSNGARRHIDTKPIKQFDVYFATDQRQASLWPSEIVLTDDYYYSLKDHAIPYDFRGLKAIQSNARAQDIYLWMTQRLCRIPENKPLPLSWKTLLEMFGGSDTILKSFKQRFRDALIAARTAYPSAILEETKDGFTFYHSLPPIEKIKAFISQP